MQLEIEIKSWVRQPRQLEAKFNRLGFRHLRDYRKEDHYFRSAGGDDVRVRLDENAAVVTFKDKRVVNGLEINNEHEFEVSESGEMIELLGRLGCRKLVEKVKIGSAWSTGDLLLELSEILGLGYFLEIERVAELPDGASAAEQDRVAALADRDIRATLRLLEIPEIEIESKSYTSMLLALTAGK